MFWPALRSPASTVLCTLIVLPARFCVVKSETLLVPVSLSVMLFSNLPVLPRGVMVSDVLSALSTVPVAVKSVESLSAAQLSPASSNRAAIGNAIRKRDMCCSLAQGAKLGLMQATRRTSRLDRLAPVRLLLCRFTDANDFLGRPNEQAIVRYRRRSENGFPCLTLSQEFKRRRCGEHEGRSILIDRVDFAVDQDGRCRHVAAEAMGPDLFAGGGHMATGDA